MRAPRRLPHVPGYVRALGVLALLLGIALMHSAVFATGNAAGQAHHMPSAAHTGSAEHPGGLTVAAARDGSVEHQGNLPPSAAHDGSAEHPGSLRPSSAHRWAAGDSLRGDSPDLNAQHPAPAAAGTSDPHAPAGTPGTPTGDRVPATRDHATAHDDSVALGGDCTGCSTHGGMHACVFVLVALLAAITLAVLAWIGADRARGSGRGAGPSVRHRPRPPPWTVHSLAELAILRI